MQFIDSFKSLFMSIIFIEYIYSAIENGENYKKVVLFIVGTALFMVAVQIVLIYYNRVIFPKGNQILYEKLNLLMFEKATDVELACYENPDFYNKYTKTASQVKGIALKFIDTFARMISHIITILYVLIKLLNMKNYIAIILAIIPIFSTYAMQNRINKIRYEYDMENVYAQRRKEYVTRTIFQSNYAKEIRLSNIHEVLFENFEQSISDLIKNIKKYGKRIAKISFAQGFVSVTVLYAFYNIYAILQLILFHTVNLSEFVVLVNTMIQLNYNIAQMTSIIARFNGYNRYIEDLRSFLNYVPKISQKQAGITPPKAFNHISLRNVSFSYNNSTPVLKNINIDIAPGEKVALVGHNGAGKSTFGKILMRLYDVQSGEILLNGINIKEYNVKSYRDLFSVVFQDYKVLSMTIAENVLMDKVEKNKRNIVINSLKLSGVYEKIKTLKKGIDTVLTKEFDENGVVLSGGELQKIAIARIFAKKFDIAILDEPSSALDPIAEYQVYKSMMKACEGKTILFISHRLSSTLLANKIYLFDNGEIIESGSHNELMKRNGKYARMFRMQAEKYIEK